MEIPNVAHAARELARKLCSRAASTAACSPCIPAMVARTSSIIRLPSPPMTRSRAESNPAERRSAIVVRNASSRILI